MLAAVAEPVRLAAPDDEDELLDMCRARHAEEALRTSAGRPFGFSEEKARATLQRALQRGRNEPDAGQAWCGVLGAPNRLMGGVYLTVQSPHDSDDVYLMELWNWVYPEYRRSTDTSALIRFSQALAGALQLPLVGGVVSYDLGEPAKMRFFRRNGCRQIASLYLYHAAGAA